MKILILSTKYTGLGHNSIANAIVSECKDRNIDTKIIDMFDITAKYIKKQASSYGKRLEFKPSSWKFWYNFAQKHHEMCGWFFAIGMKKKFKQILDEFQPDVVVSVHPNYVHNIINFRKRYKYNFKYVAVVADPVTPNSCFIHKKADLNVIPTQEGYNFLQNVLKIDMSEYKTAINILPVRKEIVESSKNILLDDILKYELKEPLNVVIISGGDGSSNYECLVDNIIINPAIHVNAVCGRNIGQEKRLRDKYSDNPQVTIYGYVEDMPTLIKQNDIGILRASPNTILEFISFGVPIILIGAAYGQEEGNISYVVDNKIGYYCPALNDLTDTLEYLRTNVEIIKELKVNEINLRKLDAASTLVNLITSVV
jgi:processive 1,2-diacylglycerol beta-glucosyltransferase